MYIMALDYHQATPPAEVRFHDEGKKSSINTNPRVQDSRAQEIRNPEGKISSPTSKSDVADTQAVQAKSKPFKQVYGTHAKITQLISGSVNEPTAYNQRRQSFEGRQKTTEEATTEVVQKEVTPTNKRKRQPSEVYLRGLVKQNAQNSEAKNRAIFRAQTKLDSKIAKLNERRNGDRERYMDNLVAAESNEFTSATYADIEALEREDQQLQAAADAYDKQEIDTLVRKYPDSMRKKRAKIISAPETKNENATNPEALIASIRAIFDLAQAKDAKKISQPAKNVTAEGESVKPQDVLAGMSDMDNHLERAFNAILNGQPDIADSARAALSSNFQFQALE